MCFEVGGTPQKYPPCVLFTGIYGLKGILFVVPPISKPTRYEAIAPSEETQHPTPRPWTGFEAVRLETTRALKHAWFHCTTAAHKFP
ncbi:hypothetical protein E2C01_081277 [Portunus trituberculatus]|uniref:Uncharacterized protein n=1 Tax=Portunus trituberculatus TaxID=210409 RepID=A0A5B7J0P0_PORTR|nr:hypothetical protein [Portunus trituberculatus]